MMLSVGLSISKLPSSLPLCKLGCSVFPPPAFLPFPQRPLVDNIRSRQEDAAEERALSPLVVLSIGDVSIGGKRASSGSVQESIRIFSSEMQSKVILRRKN